MLLRLLLSLAGLGLAAHPGTAAVTLDCKNSLLLGPSHYRYIEHRCHTSADVDSSIVLWTHVSESGDRTAVATCYGLDNCTSDDPNIEVERDETSSAVQVLEAVRAMSGVLSCSERHSNGSVDTASCSVNVVSVRFKDCPYGHQLQQDESITVFCEVSPSVVVHWQLLSPSGQTRDISTCYGFDNCTSSGDVNITVHRWLFESEMTLDHVQRHMAGTVICTDGRDSSRCALDVQSPASVSNCRLQTHPENWTTSVTCDVSRAYSATGDFWYQIEQEWQSPLSSSIQRKFLFDGRKSFTPSPYTDTATSPAGVEYFKGRYSYSWSLQPLEGSYSYTTVTGPGQVTTTVNNVLEIERPSPPSVQCEGALRDAGPVWCVCSTSSVGSPAGRLIWFSGDTVLASGHYGVTSLQFPSDVSDGMIDSKDVTCQLDWIVKENVSTTLFAPSVSPQCGVCNEDVAMLKGIAIGAAVVLALVIAFLIVRFIWQHRQSDYGTKTVDQGQDERRPSATLQNYTSLQFMADGSRTREAGDGNGSGYTVT